MNSLKLYQLDVSDLEPCEPLQRIKDQMVRLVPGEGMRVIHRREPHLLYPMLEKAGLEKVGRLPQPDYPVGLPAHDSVLYALVAGRGHERGEQGKGPTARRSG